MRIPAFAVILCAALAGCGTAGVATPGVDTPSAPFRFDAAAVTERCQGLLKAVEGFRQLGETDTDAVLDQILGDSKASAEWESTTKADRALTEASFEKAKTGSC